MPITEISHKGPKLQGAKNPNDRRLPGVVEPVPDQSYFFSLFVGGPGQGKTSLLLSLLQSPDAYAKKFDSIFFYSASLHTLPESFVEKLAPSRTFTSLDGLAETIEAVRESDDNAVFIFDDMVKSLDKVSLKLLTNLAYNRRHIGKGCSMVFITQKVRAVPLQLRTAIDSVYFFNWRSKREIEAVGEDYATAFMEEKDWLDVIKYTQKKNIPHSFIFLNLALGRVYLNWNELKLDE